MKSNVEHRRRLAQAIHTAMSGVEASLDVLAVLPEDIELHKDRTGSIIQRAVHEGRQIYPA